jgi:hypothetical protein
MVYGGAHHDLSKVGKTIGLKAGNDSIVIKYDGLRFIAETVTGDVYINGNRAASGAILPDCCVVILGDPSLGAARTFLPFNVSHPGVVL